ncbi:MAG TPA: T9SS type A sorting domain-containing protein, partial [Candidatus Sabulitectum sp.]|nr:T9SS type A sorting domain-containing protein [Candidatus Sabulitectum sp.]
NNFLGDPATRFAPGQMGVESPEGPSGRPVLLSVSPNPSPGQCAVEFQLPEPSSASIGVYDMTGRMVVSICNGDLPAGRGSVQADLSGFPSGCYRVVMHGSGGMVSAPVLVLR